MPITCQSQCQSRQSSTRKPLTWRNPARRRQRPAGDQPRTRWSRRSCGTGSRSVTSRPAAGCPPSARLAEVLGVGRNTVRGRAAPADRGRAWSAPLSGRSGGTRVRDAADAGHTPRSEILGELPGHHPRLHRVPPGDRNRFAARLAAGGARPHDARQRLLRLLDEPAADLSGYHRLDSEFHLGRRRGQRQPGAGAGGRAGPGPTCSSAGNALWLQAGWSLGHAGSPAPEPRVAGRTPAHCTGDTRRRRPGRRVPDARAPERLAAAVQVS